MTKRRVVITGMGAVTPCGIGVDKFWNSMLEGKSGVSLIEAIDTEKHKVKIAAEIKRCKKNGQIHSVCYGCSR